MRFTNGGGKGAQGIEAGGGSRDHSGCRQIEFSLSPGVISSK